jgi:hypothetical protein
MGFVQGENISTILGHTMFGLARERLIEDSFHFGSVDFMQKYVPKVTEGGLTMIPSGLGVELFLWAYGLGHMDISRYLVRDVQLPPYDITIPLGSEAVQKLK